MKERKSYIEYHPDLEQLARKKRVCAYARVSSDRDEAFHSLSAQISYYQKKIAEHPDWEFVEVFADRGITGTKENREGFQRMLTACREHKVDIVLAKSITRFARNTVILLQTVRELRSLGVDIHFEEEHIETLSEKGEFMISILAARAQEESRQASENQLWRIKKSFAQGLPVTGKCLGYRLVNKRFLVEEQEEQIVIHIFYMYWSGMGKVAIAKKLNEEGVKTMTKKASWNPATIERIIRNEKYCGDLRLQKTFRTDHISKTTMKNHGERPMYFVEDDHDAIISKEEYQRTQEEIARRAKKHNRNKTVPRYRFSGMIRCGKCGKNFVRKLANASTPYEKPTYACFTSNRFGKEFCDSTQHIPEKTIEGLTCNVLGISSLEDIEIRDYIKEIVVADKHTLVFVLKDGSEKSVKWQYRSRRESWTPEMKERARQKKLLYWKQKKEVTNGS